MREQRLKELGLSFIDPQAKIIGEQAQANGLRSFVVGGTVRDALLNRPSSDVDICVSGDQEEMAKLGDWVYSQLSEKSKIRYEMDIKRAGLYTNLRSFLQNCGGGILLSFLMYLSGKTDIAPVIYPRFLVGMTYIDGEKVEFVATRSEDYSTTEGEGSRKRNPREVVVASEYEDAIRRDFTMNALYVNLATGELLDPTGNGINDIRNKIVRVTRDDNPKIVFMEDPLRILRAIRQATQLGFQIDPRTVEIMKDLMKENGADFFGKKGSVSKERINEELSKVLISKDPTRGLSGLLNLGVLDVITPEISELAYDKEARHKNLWGHTLAVINNAQITPEIEMAIENTAPKVNMTVEDLRKVTLLRLKLSSLLHDVGKIPTRTYGEYVCNNCKEKTHIRNFFKPKCEKCGAPFSQNCIKGSPSFHQHQFASEKIAKDILRRLKFDRQMIDWVGRDCALHQVQFDNYMRQETPSVQPGLQPSKTMLAEKLFANLADRNPTAPDVWDELNFAVRIYGIVQADSSANPAAQKQRVNNFISQYEMAKKLRQEEQQWLEFNKPALSGDEIIQMFNVRPGKWIGNIHNRIRQDKLDNPEGHTRERAIQIAQDELSKWGPEIYNK